MPAGSAAWLPAGSAAWLPALRSIEYAALHVSVCHLARQEIAPENWRVLPHQYAQAEQLGLAQAAIGEAPVQQTCTSA